MLRGGKKQKVHATNNPQEVPITHTLVADRQTHKGRHPERGWDSWRCAHPQPPPASTDPTASDFLLFCIFCDDQGRVGDFLFFWDVAPSRASSLRLGLKPFGNQPAITKWISIWTKGSDWRVNGRTLNRRNNPLSDRGPKRLLKCHLVCCPVTNTWWQSAGSHAVDKQEREV